MWQFIPASFFFFYISAEAFRVWLSCRTSEASNSPHASSQNKPPHRSERAYSSPRGHLLSNCRGMLRAKVEKRDTRWDSIKCRRTGVSSKGAAENYWGERRLRRVPRVFYRRRRKENTSWGGKRERSGERPGAAADLPSRGAVFSRAANLYRA